MTRFRVFVGAPTHRDLQQGNTYTWQSVSSAPSEPSVIIPPATLEAASRRISLLYQNIIFHDGDQDAFEFPSTDDEGSSELQQSSDLTNSLISWSPTGPERQHRTISFLGTSVSRAQITSIMHESQITTHSFDHSDASSIAHFPAFHFNLHALTSLSAIAAHPVTDKVSLLLAILEVEGPDTIRIKKGPDAGKEITILKMIMGDADGHVCKITAWREVAEAWGGCDPSPRVKRGDIVWVENVRASYEPSSATVLTASPLLRSRLEICYRTMPSTHEDNQLRPDLRLGASDAAVRKVEALVKWFEEMAGLGS